ncbi:translocase subunit chloroplastic [Micractinium conductrix]|uniref:Protein translocase subunit SecA n=1 Tax=Micractinium conductrix TaxID=554055 RepID=A0A2P6VE56_9CHLO|nr:translocase subunit chloroplastic [Micractinium conductrix]|eukprot:PSC72357.1 translocase subunit chloroplastic [Micractinium conductrix]
MSSVVPGQRAAPAVQAAARLSVPGTAWQHAPLARGSPAAPLAGGRRRRAGGSRRRQAAPTQALLGGLAAVFKNDPAERTRKAYQPRVEQINALEPSMQQLSDEQLRELTAALQARAAKGEPLDSLLVESFAVVREASKRVLGLRPFDVQMIGGMILHEGQIAEMRTGEGKTLVAVLPAFLNALSGKGVHVVTVNDYLARRDSEWVGQVHRFLGLEVGLVQTGLNEKQRRAAYAADVTYVTNSELGFDYLRDNLAQDKEELVLRPFNYCVIDEVDSILIDEARTPLIISGSADKPSDKYYKAAKIATALAKDLHYTVDEKQRNVLLTEEGYEAAEDVLQVPDLYDPRTQWASYLLNAIKAKELFIRDVSYIVRNQEIIIVDEFTGRTMPGRRWSDGLHQAIEAKEALEIQNESITLASISYQNFFRAYPKLAGMTGTAATESAEFSQIYNLPVTVVPPNRTISREDNPDVVFRSENGKWRAVVQEIKRMHKTGRPVLVGTTSVEKSEALAALLDEEQIPYELLNAKPENVERESEIVAQSGRRGAVTIATNMAGRGTDILLGGNPEFMARLKLRELLLPEVVSTVDLDSANKAQRVNKIKSWAVNPRLFPREMSPEAKQLCSEAVKAAVAGWGERQLQELEAEERLAFACEKAPTDDPIISKIRDAFLKVEAEYKAVTDVEKVEVQKLGGLHVVGTERHESRRIDNQLRGRSGRQGDPGSTRYFLSLEDNLFRIFGGDRIKGLMSAFRIEDLPIESQMLTSALDEAQRKVESYFYDIRKQLFEYDQVLNTQRDKVYGERRRALEAADLTPLMVEYAERTIDDILEANIPPSTPAEEWPLEPLVAKLRQYCYLLADLTPEGLAAEAAGDYDKMRSYLRRRGLEAYEKKRSEMDSAEAGLASKAERFFVLVQTDNLWKEHLQAIKFLQQAVSLRGYAQRDPLVEYKLEGYNLFVEMMAQIRRNVIYNVYMFKPEEAEKKAKASAAAQASAAGQQSSSRGKKAKAATA